MSLLNKSWLKTEDGSLYRVNDLTNFYIIKIPSGIIVLQEPKVERRVFATVLRAENKYNKKQVFIKSLDGFKGEVNDVPLIKEILALRCRKSKA